jgi:hypothetical protein
MPDELPIAPDQPATTPSPPTKGWDVIPRIHRANLFIVTAVLEVGTGLLLLFVPAVPLALLLGVGQAAPEALLVTRVAGAALLAIGVACWSARNGGQSAAQLGLLIGILIYDGAAAALLAYAALGLGMVGMALWPAVVAHAALAVWCVRSLRAEPPAAKRAV